MARSRKQIECENLAAFPPEKQQYSEQFNIPIWRVFAIVDMAFEDVPGDGTYSDTEMALWCYIRERTREAIYDHDEVTHRILDVC